MTNVQAEEVWQNVAAGGTKSKVAREYKCPQETFRLYKWLRKGATANEGSRRIVESLFVSYLYLLISKYSSGISEI